MTSRIKVTMVENRFENMSSGNPQPVAGISRRELLKRGGKVAAAAAVASAFSPFVFTGKAAATKTLSFWQFYAPARQLGIQSKWFEDCVKAWNATHDVKVELQFVPVEDYIHGSKLHRVFTRTSPGTRLCGKEVVKSLRQTENTAPLHRRPPFRL
jgi:hypothetical protein